jgi:voltage-gated potassium channel
MSTVTAFIVENKLTAIFRERRMQKSIASLNNHFIVCGLGEVGYHVATELHSTGREAVLLDHSAERVEFVREALPRFFALLGEATEEDVLRQAGIERAAGLLAALPDDGQNMLITVQARYINPRLKIGARCQAKNLQDKFFRAGANYVVNPSFIGAMRMASEMIRPQVVSFLDRMLRGKDPNVRVEELDVEPGSRLIEMTLADARLMERTGLNPIALKHADSPDFIYNPEAGEVFRAGTVIIVIGNHEQIASLRQLCQA